MNIKECIEKLHSIIPAERILVNEPMSLHTTFKAGGRASAFLKVYSPEELRRSILLLKEGGVPFFVVGRGSNLLVSDKGYEGIILNLGGCFGDIRSEGTRITVGAGATLGALAAHALNAGLTGLEFAAGIPGTVGGGVFMNAGAYDGEISRIIVNAGVMTMEGKEQVLKAHELELSYRSSIFKRNPIICLEAVFELERGEAADIKARMDELSLIRRQKQPLEYPSAGSTFKRPVGNYAGKLIMEAGLAGKRVGGASVSDKHCGFIVNDRGASASDIKELMDLVTDRVMESFGVHLEPEVCLIGEF